jgi:hypothetical protein
VVHGTVRSLFQLLGALGMTALVLVAWFGFRLSEGPLSLSLLGPYIEDAFSAPGAGMAVKLDRTVLAWSRDTRTLEIRVENVRAMSGDGAVIAAVPEMTVALSGPALLRGTVVPRRIAFRHPVIRLLRDARGEVQMGMGEPEVTGDKSLPALLEPLQALLTPPGAETVGGQLQRVDIEAADVSVDDEVLRIRWHAPRADMRFIRDARGIATHARIDLQLAGEQARFDADGHYSNADRTLQATLSFGGIRPPLLAALVPQLAPLAALNLPTGGSVAVRYSLDQGVSDVRFDLVGGQGVIDLSQTLGISAPVDSVAFKGSLSDGLERLVLEELRVDLGGPRLTIGGTVAGLTSATEIDADARIDDMPLDMVKGLWPPEVAPNPRSWILANLSHGRVRSAALHLAAHRAAGKAWDDLAIDQIGGEIRPEGVSIRYLAPMPEIENGDAVATFDANAFTIAVQSGEVSGLKVLEGKVVLSGLSAPDQMADISVKVGGAVSDALRLIDNKPLGWAQSLGVRPATVKGDATTTLSLRFPLLNALTFDQVKVHAQVQANHFGLPDVALGLDLADGQLAAEIDAQGLDVAGKAQIGGIPADIRWHENFAKGGVRSHYLVSAILSDAQRRVVGLDAAPFQPPMLSGPVPVDLSIVQTADGHGEIEATAALTEAHMTLPSLNWEKVPGVTGQAAVTLRMAGGRLTEIPKLAVTAANGFVLQGQGGFENGAIRRLTFSRAKWGRSDLKGGIIFRPDGDGLGIDLTGASFDAREIVSGQASDHSTDRAPVSPAKPVRSTERPTDLTPLAIQGKFQRVWVSDQGSLKDVNATLSRDRRDWRQVRIDGLVEGSAPLRVDLFPAGPNRRSLKVTGSNAGAVFKSFDIYDNVVGGQLLVTGSYDDADPRQPLSGQITVSDFQLVQAPALARLLTVASLTGIVDVLQGTGIPFSTLEAPFTLTDGVLALRDARASGTSLGITVKGQVDLDNDVIALEGTVVPIYALNSVLGKLPVVGTLFSDEKGGGVFAMNYAMNGPSKDPAVTVNPLSAFTPGMLRRLFNIFDTGHETEVRPKEKAPDGAATAPPSQD